MRSSWDETWMSIAHTIAKRSLCSRDQVGAVVVSASNRIVDTGYNGPPAGFRNSIHSDGAPCVEWCPRAQHAQSFSPNCGNVDIHPPHDQCPGAPHMFTLRGDYSDCPALHAEANALMFSDRRLREGGTIYVSSGTCGGCAKLVANSGLARAVYAPSRRPDGADHRDSDRWYGFLSDCGLEVYVVGAE